jgi:hypothetical protein
MGRLTPGATYIYESPDQGKTIYARESGKTEKILIGKLYDRQSSLSNDLLWKEIRYCAENDQELKELFEQILVIYSLKKNV